MTQRQNDDVKITWWNNPRMSAIVPAPLGRDPQSVLPRIPAAAVLSHMERETFHQARMLNDQFTRRVTGRRNQVDSMMSEQHRAFLREALNPSLSGPSSNPSDQEQHDEADNHTPKRTVEPRGFGRELE